MSDERKPGTPAPRPAEPEERGEPQISRPPDYKIQYGRVQAAVWRRDIEGRASYSISLTRSYKDKYDQWQRTTSLDEDDLLPASKALDDAYTWIQRQRHQAREGLHELNVPPRAANP
ncbi:MAG TPA: hypothetical protein VFT74_06795 [Isosphaeraceae bacterium]|nr:hypothetical protein [Isosphaeraceae bacterium]